MKINEVEAKVGITRKNIRFYEEQGLIAPRRNAENGYRDYGEEEVEALCRIKLLRKLGVPIEEIRHMLTGTHTVADGMRRHLISLEREQRNLDQSITLCREMQSLDIPVSALDTEAILARMADMEHQGTSFQNSQEKDMRLHYVAPVIVTVMMVALMLVCSGMMIWAYRTSPEDSPPIWLLWVMIGFCAAVGGGVILALTQRIHEIQKGEMDDARRY